MVGTHDAPGTPGALTQIGADRLADALHFGLAVIDASGQVLDVNPALAAVTGHADSASLARALATATNAEGIALPESDLPWLAVIRTGDERHHDVVGVSGRWLRVRAAAVDLNGATVALTSLVDITAEYAMSAALRAAEHRFALAATHAPLGIAVVSLEDVLLETNDAFARLLGHPAGTLTGRTFASLTHGDDLAVDKAHTASLLAGEAETYRIVKRCLGSDGEPTWAQVTLALARGNAGEPLYFLAMVEDVAAERAATAALAHQASHDELTGLPNRVTLLARTTEALNRAAVSGRPMALLLCDLDHFKLINDSRGHAAGDAVLQETAERLQLAIRDGDAVARIGGDEFVVLCEALPDREHAEQVAQRLIDDLTLPMVRAQGVSMTVSIGIALSEPGITAADLLRNADAALYRAKADGRDRHALFAPELIEQAARRLGIEHELREAMREESLFLHYQPVRRLHDGSVAAYEALVRWDHPTRGILPPDAFLPIAEASDLVLELDRYVLLRSCEDAMTWAASGDDDAPSVSVNISARHVGRGLLPGLVARALSRSGLEPGRLTLELTETALLGVTPTAIAELDTVVALGVRLAIDDFGTGYSSLTYLSTSPRRTSRSTARSSTGCPAPPLAKRSSRRSSRCAGRSGSTWSPRASRTRGSGAPCHCSAAPTARGSCSAAPAGST